MQLTLIAIVLLSVFTASGLAVAHFRRANRKLAEELGRYARMESQWGDSEERYRTLFDLVPVGCVVWEPGFRVVEWNREAERIFGWVREEMVGNTLYNAVLSEKGLEARQTMTALFADGMSNHAVIPMVAKDGREFICEWRSAVLRGADGRPAKIVSMCTDITRQKAQARELAMFRALAEFTEDPLVSIVSPEKGGRFVFVSDATCRHYGLSREQLLAMSPHDMDLHCDALRTDGLAQEIREKKVLRFETEHRTASGEPVPVEVLLNVFEHDGESFVAHYIRDIRERKALEAEKLRLEAEAARGEGEKLLARLAASAPGLMFTSRLGPDGVVSMPYASSAIRDVFGLEPEAVAESIAPIHAVIHPGDRDHVAATIENSARSQCLCQMEFRVIHPGKGEIWVGARSMPECQPDGGILWHGFMMDITDSKRAEALLHAREQEFRTLAEHSPDVVVRYGLDCSRLYVNPAWERVNGIPAAEGVGKSPVELSGKVASIAPEFQNKLKEVMDSGQPADIDLAWLDDEGQIECFAMWAVPEFGQDGEVASVLTVSRDYTRRKRLENGLAALEREFRTLAENLPDNLIRHDRLCRSVYMNPAMERTFGTDSANALLGKTPLECHPGDDAMGAYEEVLRRVLETGVQEELEIPFDGSDGETHFHQIRFAPERGEGGEIVGALAIGRDITERKHYEEMLEGRIKLERQLWAVAASVPGFIFTIRVDLDGHVSVPFASPGVEALFGLRPEDIRSDAAVLRALYHPDDLPRVLELMEQTLRTLEPFRIEIRIHHPEKGQRWIEIRSTPQRQPDGATEWHGLMIDITERKQMELQLERSRREFASLAENLPDNIVRWDTEGCYLYINPTHERTLGRSAGEVIGTFIPDTHEHVKAAVAQVAATGQTIRGVRQPVPVNGVEELHDVIIVPEFDEAGNVIGVLGLGRDMTDTYLMQDSLREQKEFQETLLNAMNEVGMQLMVIENGRLVHVSNRKLAREFGYADAEVDAAPPLMDIIHPDDRGWVMDNHLRRLGGEDVPSSYEVGLVTRNGERREYEVSVAVVPGTDPVRVISVGKDISGRKQAEEALLEGKRFVDSLLDAMPIPVFYKDRQGRYLGFNRAYEDFFGVDRSKLVGTTVFDSHPRELAETYRAKDEALFESGGVQHYEAKAKNAQGLLREVTFDKAVFFDIRGNLGGLIGAMQDVTERKVAEAAREDALVEAQRLAQLRSAFLSRMSHELRTPLNGILGYAQNMLADDTLEERHSDGLTIIQRSGDHLLSLINNILDHAKLEADKLEISIGNIRVAFLLVTVADIIRVRAEEKGLDFICEFAPELPAVIRGDEQRLRQVLLNLLSNGVKFTDQGWVSLGVSLPAKGRMRFEVRDSGIGIAEEQREAIFEPFRQEGDASRRTGGTGLGLTISRQLVRMMGSDIAVESRLGEGSTFSFEMGVEAVGSATAKPDASTGKAAKGPAGPAPQSLAVPPKQELETLLGLAQRGNMRSIALHAAHLIELDERYRPFAAELRRMAKAYQSKAIVDFVERYLEGKTE